MPIPKYIKEAIQKNNDHTIASAGLNNLGLDDGDIEEIINLLSTKKSINFVDLSYNNLSKGSCSKLAKLSNILELNLSQNNLGDSGIRVFSENYTHDNYRKINFRHNGLTLKSVENLKELIIKKIKIDIADEPEIEVALHSLHTFFKPEIMDRFSEYSKNSSGDLKQIPINSIFNV